MDIYLQGMRDRSMRSGAELAWGIELADWLTAANLSNRSTGVQIPRDICTLLKQTIFICLSTAFMLSFLAFFCCLLLVFGKAA